MKFDRNNPGKEARGNSHAITALHIFLKLKNKLYAQKRVKIIKLSQFGPLNPVVVCFPVFDGFLNVI